MSRYLLLAAVSLVLSAGIVRAQPRTLLNDTFADGERITQSPPDSLAWYVPGSLVNSVTTRAGSIALNANDNDRLMWGYLPSALSLDIGDSLVLTVDFSFDRAPAASVGAFKIALCSSNGIVLRRSDGGPPVGGYQGYASFTNAGDATAGTRLRKRNGSAAGNPTATLLELSDGDTDIVWNTFGANRTGLAGALQANVAYTKTLRLTRTGATSMRVTTSITGGTLAVSNTLTEVDAAQIFTAFDTVAIGAAEVVQAGNLTLTRVQLVHEVNTARLTNLSVLTSLSGEGDSFTMGYVVGGSGTSGAKPLVIRAAGPSLGALGVAGALEDPKLEIFAGETKTGENDNWGGGQALATAMTQVGAFAYMAPTSRDAAIATEITTANNSARVSATGGGSGAVIAELYDATPSAGYVKMTPRLVNVSVLKPLGGGLTVGFVVGGTGSKTVLIRAIGPSLQAFGVAGAVANPRFELFAGSQQIGANDNWGGSAALAAAFSEVGAFNLANASRDAALLITLDPGNYSVAVSGVGGSGTALVEVYEVP